MTSWTYEVLAPWVEGALNHGFPRLNGWEGPLQYNIEVFARDQLSSLYWTANPGLKPNGPDLQLKSPSWGYKISGITRDGNGDVLGGCEVILIEMSRSKSMLYPSQKTTSDAATGAYTFYVEDDNCPYMIIARKDGVPVLFGRTDIDIKGEVI